MKKINSCKCQMKINDFNINARCIIYAYFQTTVTHNHILLQMWNMLLFNISFFKKIIII